MTLTDRLRTEMKRRKRSLNNWVKLFTDAGMPISPGPLRKMLSDEPVVVVSSDTIDKVFAFFGAKVQIDERFSLPPEPKTGRPKKKG